MYQLTCRLTQEMQHKGNTAACTGWLEVMQITLLASPSIMISKNVCCWDVMSIHLLLDGLHQVNNFFTEVADKQSNIRIQMLQSQRICFAPHVVDVANQNQLDRLCTDVAWCVTSTC